MHTAKVSDSDGEFNEWHDSDRPHGNCGGAVKWRSWESSDGGHEDYQYRCEKCGAKWWVDGCDS